VSNRIDIAAILLFCIITCWQMPHFYAIAMYRLEDYAKASIPVLPIRKGMYNTKVHMLLYVIAFTVTSISLTMSGHTGFLYLLVCFFLGICWTALCIRGFSCSDNKIWARKMFMFSLVVVMVQCSMLVTASFQ